MKKILLLGSKGFLGSKVKNLIENSLDIDLYNHDRSIFPLNDTENLLRLLQTYHPDAIINCAATVNFDPHYKENHFYAINVLIPSLLADWCVKKNNKYYLHVSGTIVNGTKASRVYARSPYNPNSYYGYSKYLAELNIFCSGAKSSIIRFGGIWGQNGPQHLGINKALADALAGKQLTLFGKGGLRNYIHVNCAAATIVHLLKQQLTGTFIAAAPSSITIEKMITLLGEKFKLPSPLIKSDLMIHDTVLESSDEIKNLILNFEEALDAYF